MMCLVTVRQLKPGSYEDFRTAWAPDPWPPQLSRVEILRNDDNPDEVITIGYVDVTPDELDAMRDEPEVLAGEARRLERIAPFEDRVLVNSVFELVEEVPRPA
jgi:hypothetical protein